MIRSYAAMHTWATEEDIQNITKECAVSKAQVTANLGSLSSEMEGMIHFSNQQLKKCQQLEADKYNLLGECASLKQK